MIKRFLSVFLLILSPIPIYADDFFPSGELSKNEYIDTAMFGISNIPSVGSCPGCIEYDTNLVEGDYTKDIFQNVSIDDVSYADSNYGLVRKSNVYDRMSVPPFSTIDIIYLFKNMAGETVNISNLGVFLSRDDKKGPSNLLNVNTEYKGVLFNISSVKDMRYGNLKMYDGLGLVNDGGSGSIILDTLSVKSPLLFKEWEINFEGGLAQLKVSVKNNGNELLHNVEYNHKGFSVKRDFSAMEEYTYEYTLPNTTQENIEYPNIFDPNIKMECAVSGKEMESPMIGNSAIIYGVREKNGEYLNYVSSRTKPWVESFCITRLPYKMYSPLLIDINNTKEEISEDEEPQALGVSENSVIYPAELEKLPQTGTTNSLIYYLIVFLVVIAVLCYYHIRRKKNEDKIYNAVACTKGRKNIS